MFDLLCSHSNGEQSSKGGNSITWYKFTFGVDVNLNLSIGIFFQTAVCLKLDINSYRTSLGSALTL